ncbi:MAG: hypothetical protein JSV49_07115 [Thermoplasmata archaeon]|nr:MAG: hypothetical protein JSV49_07115 [Thermoplasmata archaeon]
MTDTESTGGQDLKQRPKTRSNPGRTKARSRPRKKPWVYSLLWLLPLISIFILIWMIVLEMGVVGSQDNLGVSLDQWFMLSVFIIICCIIIMILSVVGTLLGETSASAAAAGAAKAKGAQGVVIEAVPEEDQAETAVEKAVEKPAKEGAEAAITKEMAKEVSEELGAEAKAEVVSAKAKKAPSKAVSAEDIAPRIIEYPTKVGSGLYGDTYVKIGNNRILKLRTILFDESNLY